MQIITKNEDGSKTSVEIATILESTPALTIEDQMALMQQAIDDLILGGMV